MHIAAHGIIRGLRAGIIIVVVVVVIIVVVIDNDQLERRIRKENI